MASDIMTMLTDLLNDSLMQSDLSKLHIFFSVFYNAYDLTIFFFVIRNLRVAHSILIVAGNGCMDWKTSPKY